MFQIRDNIHGDITMDGMFANIINTPEFQRLRYVEQGSFRTVFPGARHDRFAHSLGTYHLAGKFVDSFFQNIKQDLKDKGVAAPAISAAGQKRLKTTFRYAALLHDIGHAPFSHTTEGLFAETPGKKYPLIWEQLCDEVKAVASPADYDRFVNSTSKKVGSPHEIASAILLIRNRDIFLRGDGSKDVDLELAARMVIGYTYKPSDFGADPNEQEEKGIRNCLIQLLNSSILDVDRLDYLGRDTVMSGFSNAILDLDTLAASVTAVRLPDGWLIPAYRDSALRVFDLMFQAKLSHDAWVIASPAGPYDAGLTEHCIRRLNDLIDPDYTKTIFSVDALGRSGVELKGRHYRLLSDVDVSADLKAQTDPEFQELYTRELGKRRIAAWRSYYEFQHIFDDPANGITAKKFFDYFRPLLDFLEDNHIFVFNQESCRWISANCTDKNVTQAADFLRTYFNGLTSDPDKKDSFNVVLLKKKNNFTMGIDPKAVRIVFPKNNIPLRLDGRNYSTYQELTGITKDDTRSSEYFYLYRHGGLGKDQLAKLRKSLKAILKTRS
ncbi:MAG: HD domain-containing protein [Oscillospiraceae bacterium]|nr:HD domain-containing protein [Oscillospiraceae bacterium]